MFKGIYTIIFPAPNLQSTKEWYTKILGIEPYFDEAFYVGFNVGGYELGLDPSLDKDGGPVTYLGVDDAEKAYNHLLENGAKAHGPVHDVGDGIKVGEVIDLNGNIFGIIKNLHFKVGQ